MSKGLFKKAAIAIKSLYEEKTSLEEEVNSLKSELNKLAQARDVAFLFLKRGAFPAEDFEDKFNEFSQKTVEELETFEKAAEYLGTQRNNSSFGTLSDAPQSAGSPEDRFIYSLMED